MSTLLLAAAVAMLELVAGAGGTVVGSKHDLSISGPGPMKAVSETDPCIFCHVSHRGREGMSNRPDVSPGHRAYESSTMRRRPGGPTGSSRICLSCHDGTIAVGDTVARRIAVTGGSGGRIPASRRANLGTDLRATHPISFTPGKDAGAAPRRDDPVKLDRSGELQCTTCHDPHREYVDSAEGKFLVKSNRRSELCLTCHAVLDTGSGSSHMRSGAAYGATQGNETPFGSVGEAGCLACHRSHGGDAGGRLLKKKTGSDDDGVCLACHDGSVASDVARQMRKPFAHAEAAGRHDAAEGPLSTTSRLPETSASAPRHVACVDCHNPHVAYSRRSTAPLAGGALAGVWGIDASGRRVEQVQFEYEVCYKCHADSANRPRARGALSPSRYRRAVEETNLRRVFDPGAPSSHPVVAPGRNADVPSLRSPFSAASVIYCSDCHSSEEGQSAGRPGPRAPHGSVYAQLLARNYETADFTLEGPTAYALCYGCHDRDVLLSDRSAFPYHRAHVVVANAPCSACHASHGVAASVGTAANNAHLIDFDVSIVKPDARGVRQYVSKGARTGSCALVCHDHHTQAPAEYPPIPSPAKKIR